MDVCLSGQMSDLKVPTYKARSVVSRRSVALAPTCINQAI